MLTFDEASHTYHLRGERLPSVTQVLRPAIDLSMIPDAVLARKREIGEAVHAAIELDVQDRLDEDSIHEDVAPYFDGWRRFMREKQPKIIACELRVYHTTYRYAGTLDLLAEVDGELTVIDTKSTAAMSPVTALQTAAYTEAYCFERDLPRNLKRAALHLTADSDYRLHHYRNPMDFTVFLGLRNFLSWREQQK
jgi:hypothetical protein